MIFSRKKEVAAIDIDCGGKRGLVSVVLPVYNGEGYLKEAIESVLCQTYEEWELIIIDDGSTDSSLAIAKDYAAKDERIRAVHQENQKLPKALNNGFALAGGEYYTWISADNRFLPDFLSVMVGELLKHKSADMVFGNQYLINEEGKRILGHNWFEFPPGSGAVCFPPATPLLNTIPNNTIGAAFLYRAGCDAVLGGYSPNLFLLEDYDYFMRMNSFFCIRHISHREPSYEYRFHPESLTAHDGELKITASRPRLMEFDAYRRKTYQEFLAVEYVGMPKEIQAQLKKKGFFHAEDVDVSIVWDGPANPEKLSYRIAPEETGVYRIYKGEDLLAQVKNKKDLAGFLRLRIFSDLLRQEEEYFF